MSASRAGYSPAADGADIWLWILGGVAALAFGAGGVVWAVGELAGLLFGTGRPGLALVDAPRVIPRLDAHLGDPAAAWPAPGRERLPGPVGVYASAGLVAVAVALVGAGVAALWRRLEPGGGGRQARDQASWARPRQLRALAVSRAQAGRLTLGRIGRRLVSAEERQSVLVIAPTQAGKTTGLVIPALLEWEGPVLATSVKRDLLDETLARRRALGGEVWIFDPSGVTGIEERSAWSPLGGCDDWAGARRTASSLCSAVRREGLRDGTFWYEAAAGMLAPALLAARATGGCMGDVVSWIQRRDELEVEERLAGLDCPAAEDAWLGAMGDEDRARSSVFMTARNVLAAYADPEVALWADRSEIDVDRLLDGRPHTLYICAPLHEQERLAPLFVALIRSVIHRVYERAAAGRPLSSPLLLALDEAANVAPLPDLPDIASTGAGVGLQLMSVFQDLAQVEGRYGKAWSTLVNNHRAKILLSGISCERTLDYAGRLLGDEEVDHRSYTLQAGGGRSEQRSTRTRRLGRAEVLRQMAPGSGVLVYGHLPPAQLRMRPWFRDRGLRRLATPATVEDAVVVEPTPR